MKISFKILSALYLSLTVFSATANIDNDRLTPDFDLDIEVVQLYQSTLLIRDSCKFSGYQHQPEYTRFSAECEDGPVILKVSNSMYDVKDFNIKSVSKQKESMILANERAGIDFQKLANNTELLKIVYVDINYAYVTLISVADSNGKIVPLSFTPKKQA